MKNVFYAIGFVCLLCFNAKSFAGITVTSPSASSSIVACGDFTLYYTATSGFSTYVVVNVHQNNLSGTVVKTFSNVSSGYLAANYNNILSSSGLLPGNYQIEIYDYYNPSFNGSSDVFTISTISPPTAITVVTGQTTTTGFELSWTASSGASEYRIDISTASDFSSFVPGYNDYHASGSASGGFYVTGLTAGTTYYVRIRAYTSCYTSGNSSTTSVTTQTCTAPSAPTATAATNITTCGFTAHWNAVSGVTLYDVIITRTGFSPQTFSSISGTSYAFSSSHPATGYSYVVKSRGCTTSAESNSISVTTTALAAPHGFGANGGGSGGEYDLNISWGAVSCAAHYRFQVSQWSDFRSFEENSIVDGATSSFTKVPCLEYYVRVSSITATSEESAFSSNFYIPTDAGCDGRMAADGPQDRDPITSDPIEWLQPFVPFPNPTDQILTIGLPYYFSYENLSVKTFDATGHIVVLPFNASRTKVTLDVSAINPGTYVITLTDGRVKRKSKFLKK
ncbi:MAG: T9SS type A sorting domain-containing protein [Bacteroidota bacterium]